MFTQIREILAWLHSLDTFVLLHVLLIVDIRDVLSVLITLLVFAAVVFLAICLLLWSLLSRAGLI